MVFSKKKWFFVCCNLITITTILAQNIKNLNALSYDELKEIYFKESTDSITKVKCATIYVQKAKKEKNLERIYKGYYIFALLYYDNDNRKAIQYLDSVIKYSKIKPNLHFPAAAYNEKADFLIRQSKYEEAVVNYKEAEKYALKNNIDEYYNVKMSIGILKSEKLGEYKEALNLYKECFLYNRKKDYRNNNYAANYQTVIFGLADVYKSLNELDSCSYYNKLGYTETKITKNDNLHYMFILNEGANQIAKTNYKAGLDSINIALPKMIKFNNKGNILASYYYRGKAYENIGNSKLAILNYSKVDSMFKINRRINPEFIDGYSYMINYYKKIGDTNNYVRSLTSFFSVDSLLQKDYKYLYKSIVKQYDIPNVVRNKDNEINALTDKKRTTFYYIMVLMILILLLIGYTIYEKRKTKELKKRFVSLIESTNNENLNNKERVLIVENSDLEPETGKGKNLISKEITKDLENKLALFEKNNEYLNANLTLVVLAQVFETNTKYLSKFINDYKGKSFIQYINDLRIDYAVNILQRDKKLRNYTIVSLSNEFGFNTAESFSNSFSKKTGLKPSYFIKELEKIKS